MANNFTRNINNATNINNVDKKTNVENDLISTKDKQHYIRRKDDYYCLTDNVKSVNDIKPDEKGNVELEFSEDIKVWAYTEGYRNYENEIEDILIVFKADGDTRDIFDVIRKHKNSLPDVLETLGEFNEDENVTYYYIPVNGVNLWVSQDYFYYLGYRGTNKRSLEEISLKNSISSTLRVLTNNSNDLNFTNESFRNKPISSITHVFDVENETIKDFVIIAKGTVNKNRVWIDFSNSFLYKEEIAQGTNTRLLHKVYPLDFFNTDEQYINSYLDYEMITGGELLYKFRCTEDITKNPENGRIFNCKVVLTVKYLEA